MKKIILLVMLLLTMMISDEYTITSDRQLIVSKTITEETVPYTVIPGLYGFGTNTRAAYGSTVDPIILHVDTLVSGISNTDSTHGSLEWAISQTFPRVVVFDVSGVIDWKSGGVAINNPHISILGQTAPAPVVINGGGIYVVTHDVLIQHIAVRNKTDTITDGISIVSEQREVYNIIIDHCSVTWAADEQVSIAETKNPCHDITITNCIIGESISPHAYGSLNYGNNLAYIGNLFIHNYLRSPQFGQTNRHGTFANYNNLIYNWQHTISLLVADCDKIVGYAGNHAIGGPNTPSGVNNLSNSLIGINTGHLGEVNLYMADNIKIYDTPVSGFDVWDRPGLGYTQLSNPIDANGYVIKAANTTKSSVLANAGSRPGSRDAVDTRLINDVINGTGKIASTIPSMPAYQTLTQVFVPVANPHTMYNEHYTNLEHQLHQLAAAVETSQ